MCTLRVHWGEFVGKGTNLRIAKATAAKLATKALEKEKTSPESSLLSCDVEPETMSC